MKPKTIVTIVLSVIAAMAAAAAFTVYLTKKLQGKGVAYIECNCNDEEEAPETEKESAE